MAARQTLGFPTPPPQWCERGGRAHPSGPFRPNAGELARNAHLQLSDLAAKLAGLEGSVSRLEGEIRSAAHRSVGHEAREAHEAITEDLGGLLAEPSEADVHTRLVELPHDCRPTNTVRAS